MNVYEEDLLTDDMHVNHLWYIGMLKTATTLVYDCILDMTLFAARPTIACV